MAVLMVVATMAMIHVTQTQAAVITAPRSDSVSTHQGAFKMNGWRQAERVDGRSVHSVMLSLVAKEPPALENALNQIADPSHHACAAARGSRRYKCIRAIHAAFHGAPPPSCGRNHRPRSRGCDSYAL